MKTKFTTQQLQDITNIQERDGISRKSAIRKYKKQEKVAVKAQPKIKKVQKDFPGLNRAEGLRLYALAGRPTKEQFIRVYGDAGARWTWEQRAKHAGLASAEEAAEKFQAMLTKK